MALHPAAHKSSHKAPSKGKKFTGKQAVFFQRPTKHQGGLKSMRGK